MKKLTTLAAFTALEDGVPEIPGGEGPAGQAGDLGPFPGDDGVEDVGHGGGEGGCWGGRVQSSSSLTPCMRLLGQPARSQALTKSSRSPSMTPWTLLVSTPVRRSLTMR